MKADLYFIIHLHNKKKWAFRQFLEQLLLHKIVFNKLLIVFVSL